MTTHSDHDPPDRDQPAQVSGEHSALETREERLERIRAEIAAGTYDTDEKLDIAIERMIGRVVWDD